MELKILTRDEWMNERAKHVSSTESAALFGLSPYSTAYEVGVQKQSGAPAFYFEETQRMRWGTRLQEAIAQGIADDYGVVIEDLQYCYGQHASEPRMGASFDFRVVGVPSESASVSIIGALYEQHGPGLLEIKNVDSLQYRGWPENDAPDHIEIQVQHQLEVSELEWCVLGVLVGGNQTEVYTRMRDRQVGAAIVSRVHGFWADLDKGILPPAVMPEDADLIIRLHQYAEPSKLYNGQDDAVLQSLCDEYVSAGAVAREAQDAQKTLKAKILTLIGDSERALANGFTVSASMVAAAEVKAYLRGSYRNFQVRKKEVKNGR